MIIFRPDDTRIPLSITLLDDSVPEPPEDFRLVLSRQLDIPNLEIGQDDTIVRIEDTDGKLSHIHRCIKVFGGLKKPRTQTHKSLLSSSHRARHIDVVFSSKLTN